MPIVTIGAENRNVESDAANRKAEFDYNFGDSLAEAVAAVGEEVVFDLYIRAAKIAAQASMRQMLGDGKDGESVSAYMTDNWKPGASIQNPLTQAVRAMEKMTPEERQQFLQQMRNALE